MGLVSRLMPALLCLLACASHSVHRRRCDKALVEIIKTLNILTASKTLCTEVTVADIFAASKNTTEKETYCRAAAVLQPFYGHHGCLTEPKVARLLRGLNRNLHCLARSTNCSVHETKQSTLKDFLEKLKMIMKEKYWRSWS
ncbi:interleukin-4 [Tupaia chinensis]|uniref:interleukin-4 n=1 Tax=Tupaia chinensis TaxID=246437 RepID=UPI000FFBBC47|nr:interleukin-4 [Tupaia chinensis]